MGIFDNWHGILVRDDYAGWHQFDATLAGVQQCGAHLIRHPQGVLDLDSEVQMWAGQVQKALRDAAKLVDTAQATGTTIHAKALADARRRYDQGVLVGTSTNLSRPWHKGNHPSLVLARRLKDKADQVWLFTTNFRVSCTNNASEQALKSPKLHQKVSGYWHTTLTLARFCRVRSYLVTARNHGIRAIHAIHTRRPALAANPSHTMIIYPGMDTSRCLIAPTASSNAPITRSRPTSSATATTPDTGVNDASGAPTRTQPAKRVYSSPNGALPTTGDCVLYKPNHPGQQGTRSSRHAEVAFLPAGSGV
jgi:hypothetical protein